VAQEQLDIDYIFDFIYLDTKRLTSYLAQLDDDGVLLSIKKTEHLKDEQKTLGSVGLNIATRASTEINEEIGRQKERHYDSSSVALYSVIDKLDELGFIKKDIANTAIGQLLLCSGSITFQDIRMMRNLWDPIMKLLVNQGQSLGQGNKNKNHNLKTQLKEAELMKDILSGLPHALLMTLFSGDQSLWSSLEEDHLKINSDDITLKHGANFAGEWHVLSILDAKPDHEIEQIHPAPTAINGLFSGMVDVLSNVRQLLGRPADAYGITPLAIFRTVSR
jgi:hypothetical protein